MRRAAAVAALLLALAPGCSEEPPPDNQGIELHVSGEWPIVVRWSPVEAQRGFLDGAVGVDVDGARPAAGAVALTLNGQPLPEDPTFPGLFPVRTAGLAPIPPGGRIALEARLADGRAAAFAFDCPREVPVAVSPDPIVKGAPVTVAWSAPIFLDADPYSTAPAPRLAFCAYEPPGEPSAMVCSNYQALDPQQRTATATPLAYQAGGLGFLVELAVVGDVVQRRFQRPAGVQFHQGLCVLHQRTAFTAVDP